MSGRKRNKQIKKPLPRSLLASQRLPRAPQPAPAKHRDSAPQSKRTDELIELLRDGRVPSELPMPELATPFTGGNYATAQQLFSVPNNIPRATTRSRKRTINVTVGSSTHGILIAQPAWACFSDSQTLYTSTAAYTPTTFPTAISTGLTGQAWDTASPFISSPQRYAWTAQARITMRANSAALTEKKGRIYMGISYNDLASGDTVGLCEALQTTASWALDQISESSMPTLAWVPLSHAVSPINPIVADTAYPCMYVWIVGANMSTVFEFDIEYTSVVAGVGSPWERELAIDTDAIMCAQSSMLVTASKGFSHTLGNEPKKKAQHTSHAAVKEAKKQPFLSRVIDFGKDLFNKTPIGNVVRRAVGFASKFF